MIKKIIYCLSFISILLVSTNIQGQILALNTKLETLSKKYNFNYKKQEPHTFFQEKYLLTFNQLINPEDSSDGFFTQRVFLSHLDFSKPVIFITEGYWGEYANNPYYINELSSILQANQILVEHRYFPPSIPDSIDWQFLTIENAAYDHHKIVETLKELYSGNWVNTGISKGGQTATYHRYLYPNDVVATVAYVAPLNFSLEEKRVYRHLENVGSPKTRQAIFNYQKLMFENKNKYIPEFERLAKEKNLSYKMGIEKAYELTVLEYSFAFWQWGTTKVNDIPKKDKSPYTMIEHLDKVAGLDWISDQGIERMQPFFYQAMHQFGMYGYDISPFKEWSCFEKNPTFDFTLPKGINVEYNPSLHFKIDSWVRHEANNMMFITGEWDPWGATAVELSLDNNCVKFIKPQGSHRARILNLPEEQKKEAIEILKSWVYTK